MDEGPRRGRRRALKAALAAGALLSPAPFAWVRAQAERSEADPLRLVRAPKRALVVGNGAYRSVPVLRNPANDARAMAAALREAGFEVDLLIDADRARLERAIQAHAREAGSRKAVGLFYFAGHGMQLAWRNYLLPVEATIDRPEDIPQRCVDVGSLIDGVAAAANPMNVIILDACRENPFGRAAGDVQKGLSQVDAPVATLLAYATAPGNVASDGEGEHGLYTEHLLREIKVRESDIEDVFKRVRLAVRRKSNGRQIPWESTSLEEDFYFFPPPRLAKQSEEEAERRYRQQLAQWEALRESRDVAALEEFLRRFPSGQFSELAQLRLDRLLAQQGEQPVRVVSSAANPYSKGVVAADTQYRVGDAYTYRNIDLFTKVEGRSPVDRVIEVNASGEVVYSSGLVTDPLGNTLRARDGRSFSSRQQFPLEYLIGKRWQTRFTTTTQRGTGDTIEAWRVAARERIVVPAGEFDAYRVESTGITYDQGGMPRRTEGRYWIAPDRVRRPLAQEGIARRGNRIVNSNRLELVSFNQS